MDVHRLGIKVFIAEPVRLQVTDFIPIFHTWIQKQIVQDHLLVDVHNYSHIHHGPGILLVAHQGNFSIDMGDGRMGLLYNRKQPDSGTIHDRFVTILKFVLRGCCLLEADPGLARRLRFRTDEADSRRNRVHTESLQQRSEGTIRGPRSNKPIPRSEDPPGARELALRSRICTKYANGFSLRSQLSQSVGNGCRIRAADQVQVEKVFKWRSA